MQVVLLHSFQNVLKAVLGYRKARRVTSTSSGLKRLKTQNTMSEKRKGDTLKGIPKSIHKRELILDEEEFDASSSGGPEEIRTLDLTDANRALSQLSYKPVLNFTNASILHENAAVNIQLHSFFKNFLFFV